jgi:integrase
MGVRATQLSTTKINSLKPIEKAYAVSDGRGLHLLIKPNGSKLWEFNFVCPIEKKRKKTSLGLYPDVTLKHARDKRDEYRRLVANGINPIKYFQEIKQKEKNNSKGLFETVAKEWLALRKKELTPRSYQRVESLLLNDVVSHFKNKKIKDIEHHEVSKVIEIKNKTAPESAKRLLQYLNRLWLYAISKGYANFNVTSNIDKTSLITKKTVLHYPKITDIKILKELVNAIYNYNGHISTKNALKFVLHIPLRANNLVNMQWSYIDFENRVLTIPREEMKIKDSNFEDFTMPLSAEVMQILAEQKQYTSNKKYVFVSDYGIHINPETPNHALKRLGFNDEEKGRKQRLHSFRGTFRSLCDTYDKQHNASFEVKEIALDHRVGNSVTQSYSHRADYLEQLRELMDWWSAFVVSMLD